MVCELYATTYVNRSVSYGGGVYAHSTAEAETLISLRNIGELIVGVYEDPEIEQLIAPSIIQLYTDRELAKCLSMVHNYGWILSKSLYGDASELYQPQGMFGLLTSEMVINRVDPCLILRNQLQDLEKRVPGTKSYSNRFSANSSSRSIFLQVPVNTQYLQ